MDGIDAALHKAPPRTNNQTTGSSAIPAQCAHFELREDRSTRTATAARNASHGGHLGAICACARTCGHVAAAKQFEEQARHQTFRGPASIITSLERARTGPGATSMNWKLLLE